MVEGVVHPSIFADNSDRIWVGGIRNLHRFGRMETLGEVLSRFNDTSFTRRAEEWSADQSKSIITLIELSSTVHHLLLAEDGQLISAKGVVVRGNEAVIASESFDIGLQLLDERAVRCRFACSGVSSPVSGQDLSKSHHALSRSINADF